MEGRAFNVNVPVWTIESGPPLVVVTMLSKVNWFPVNDTPPSAVVERVPVKWVTPVPANCSMVDAEMSAAVTFVAFVIWKAASGLTPPIAPLKVIFPTPGVKVRLRAVASLLKVPPSMIAPPPEFRVMLLVNVVLEASWILPLVVKFPLSVVVGDPD